MKKIKTIAKLKEAIKLKKTLVWKDPDYCSENDYVITKVRIDNEENFDEDDSILITYNSGLSEANVYLNEIYIK